MWRANSDLRTAGRDCVGAPPRIPGPTVAVCLDLARSIGRYRTETFRTTPSLETRGTAMYRKSSYRNIGVLAIVVILPMGRVGPGKSPTGRQVRGAVPRRARTEWAKFGGANRGKGADKVSCVSCHTMLSYALGRPAARHLDGEDRPTAQEDRMLEHVRRRVANWKELDTPRFQLSYDFNEKKKVESWGTESVLNALILSLNDRRLGLRAPSDSTRDALRNLWDAPASRRAGGRILGLARLRAPSLGGERVPLLRGGPRRHRGRVCARLPRREEGLRSAGRG